MEILLKVFGRVEDVMLYTVSRYTIKGPLTVRSSCIVVYRNRGAYEMELKARVAKLQRIA
jgi:hypothetical protein